jgi:hypothetical protein
MTSWHRRRLQADRPTLRRTEPRPSPERSVVAQNSRCSLSPSTGSRILSRAQARGDERGTREREERQWPGAAKGKMAEIICEGGTSCGGGADEDMPRGAGPRAWPDQMRSQRTDKNRGKMVNHIASIHVNQVATQTY